MRTITLRPLASHLVPIEAEALTADGLAKLSVEEMETLDLWLGNRRTKLCDLFAIETDGGPAPIEETTIILDGDFSRVKRIGERMSAGEIHALGDLGMHAGAGMSGGNILVKGSASDWLGREMRGGSIEVKGDAGNYVGSGYRGERCGMRGGSILVRGSAGVFLGEHMCGGSIHVLGNAGDYPGAANGGGTISIGGDTHLPGAEMTKGSISVGGRTTVLPGFQFQDEVEVEGLTYRRYVGDLVENGEGELLLALAQQSA